MDLTADHAHQLEARRQHRVRLLAPWRVTLSYWLIFIQADPFNGIHGRAGWSRLMHRISGERPCSSNVAGGLARVRLAQNYPPVRSYVSRT